MGKDKRKPLVELDGPNGNVKQFWESGKDASRFYGFSPVYISQHLAGRIRAAKKHYFRYATQAEIETYRSINQRIEQNEQVREVIEVPVPEPPSIPVEVIPESVEKPQQSDDNLSPFDKMIKKGKDNLK